MYFTIFCVWDQLFFPHTQKEGKSWVMTAINRVMTVIGGVMTVNNGAACNQQGKCACAQKWGSLMTGLITVFLQYNQIIEKQKYKSGRKTADYCKILHTVLGVLFMLSVGASGVMVYRTLS